MRTLGNRHARRGYTLVELAMTLAILGILLQLLLPGLQAARERARQIHCMRKVKNIALAANHYQDAFNAYPSAGWHYTWIGEPERGNGLDQPGSWTLALLPYMDHAALRSLGKHQDGQQREDSLRRRCQTPLSEFICPSRRTAKLYPQTWNQRPFTRSGPLHRELDAVAKSDYAMNAGIPVEAEFPLDWIAPTTLDEGDDATYPWPALDSFNGVVFGRSRIRQKHILDGLSKTYLVGEKYLDAAEYASGNDSGDNECLYAGFDNDTSRSALSAPLRDTPGVVAKNSFGSCHPTLWAIAMCDGSVRRLTFDVTLEVHQEAATRNSSTQRPIENEAHRAIIRRPASRLSHFSEN